VAVIVASAVASPTSKGGATRPLGSRLRENLPLRRTPPTAPTALRSTERAGTARFVRTALDGGAFPTADLSSAVGAHLNTPAARPGLPAGLDSVATRGISARRSSPASGSAAHARSIRASAAKVRAIFRVPPRARLPLTRVSWRITDSTINCGSKVGDRDHLTAQAGGNAW
jgi:hypothetical protein